jgi:hypothetical protein
MTLVIGFELVVDDKIEINFMEAFCLNPLRDEQEIRKFNPGIIS